MTLTVETNEGGVAFDESVSVQETHFLVGEEFAILFDPGDISGRSPTEVINEVPALPAQSMGYVTSKRFVVHADPDQVHTTTGGLILEQYCKNPAGIDGHETVSLSAGKTVQACRNNLIIEPSTSRHKLLAIWEPCDDPACDLYDYSSGGWATGSSGGPRQPIWTSRDRGWYFRPHTDRTTDFNVFEHMIWDFDHISIISGRRDDEIRCGDWVKFRKLTAESYASKTGFGGNPELDLQDDHIVVGVVTNIHSSSDGSVKGYGVLSEVDWTHEQLVPADDVSLMKEGWEYGNAWSSLGINVNEDALGE